MNNEMDLTRLTFADFAQYDGVQLAAQAKIIARALVDEQHPLKDEKRWAELSFEDWKEIRREFLAAVQRSFQSA